MFFLFINTFQQNRFELKYVPSPNVIFDLFVNSTFWQIFLSLFAILLFQTYFDEWLIANWTPFSLGKFLQLVPLEFLGQHLDAKPPKPFIRHFVFGFLSFSALYVAQLQQTLYRLVHRQSNERLRCCVPETRKCFMKLIAGNFTRKNVSCSKLYAKSKIVVFVIEKSNHTCRRMFSGLLAVSSHLRTIPIQCLYAPFYIPLMQSPIATLSSCSAKEGRNEIVLQHQSEKWEKQKVNKMYHNALVQCEFCLRLKIILLIEYLLQRWFTVQLAILFV